MSRIIIIATIFTVIGLIFGLNIQQSEPPIPAAIMSNQTHESVQELFEANRELQARITTLETQQTEQQSSQLALNAAIEVLKTQFDEQSQLSFISTPSETQTPVTSVPILTAETFAKNKEQILFSLGIDENITSRIKQREEKLEMDRLYLRNTASREGWFGTEKYFEKTRELSVTTNVYREELGDEDYDRYLFDSNIPNRISVLSVISNSPAETAGIEKGDIISQYDNEAIFTWSDLTRATTGGEVGQQVSIVIQRNDEIIEFFIPRGPLGIRLENVKINPRS